MSGAAGRDAARRAIEAHGPFVAALYGGEVEANDDVRWLFNPHLPEPEWNHAGRIRLGAGRTASSLLDDVAARLAERGRPAAVVLDSDARPAELAAELDARGWEQAFLHTGLIFPQENLASVDWAWADGAEVEERASSEAAPGGEFFAAFLSVFESAFTETAPGYDFDGYRRALPAGFGRPLPGCEVIHTLVRVGGAPAGVGSRVLGDGVAGLYNLGVMPAARGLGLGRAITLHRAARGFAGGCDLVYLLTEDPRVEAAQRRRGFVRGFELAGHVAPAASSTDQEAER